MKINATYISKNKKQEFECKVHIENRIITEITSSDREYFEIELKKMQPSIFGSKRINFWKNTENNNYPYYLIYESKSGQKQLFLKYSKLRYLLTKTILKIKRKTLILSFVTYSFFVIIGAFLNIMNGGFILSPFELVIFSWIIIAFLIIWNLVSKLEKKEKEIIKLKNEIFNQ